MKEKYRRMLRGMKVQEEQAPLDPAPAAVWSLYILECGDGSYYTGVTVDLDRRLRQHQEGTACRYTRTRRPVVLVHREECGSRALALSREWAVKSLPRSRKEELIRGGNDGEHRQPPQ
jgi:putative endonuclease